MSPGARAARIGIVLALDALLLIAGIAMIVSYLNSRDRASSKKQAPNPERIADAQAGSVKFAEPVPLHKKPVTSSGSAKQPARKKTRGKRRGKAKVASSGKRPGTGKPTGTGKPPVKTLDPWVDAGAVATGTAPTAVDAGAVVSAAADAGAVAGATEDAGVTRDPDAPPDEEVAILARQIRLVVNRERRLLQRCYNQVAKVTTADKALQGRVEIRFEVMPDGKTKNVRPRGNTTGSNQLAQCVSQLIRNWKFPSHSGKSSIPFVWPFDFRGS